MKQQTMLTIFSINFVKMEVIHFVYSSDSKYLEREKKITCQNFIRHPSSFFCSRFFSLG